MFAAASKPARGCAAPSASTSASISRDHIARAGARAFVEGHDDVGAEQPLDFHRAFGRQQMARSIEVAGESDALLGDLAQVRQAHHLIAAAVGQDRAPSS
jgi:hypothetical protein